MFFICRIFMLLSLFVSCKREVCGNCFCTDGRAECYLNNCNSVIVKDPSVDIIKIHGHFCPNHIEELSDIFYHNVIIELMDSSCIDLLFNCRDGHMPHTVIPPHTTRKYPFPPHKPEEDNDGIDYDDDEDRDDDPDDGDDSDDSDDEDFFYGLLSTVSNLVSEETTSDSPLITTVVTESKILKALTEKDLPESITEKEQVKDITEKPALPIPEPAFDPAVAAVKDKKDNLEEEDSMNVDTVPTHMMMNYTTGDFHDRDELTQLERILIGFSAALCTLIVFIICCCKFKTTRQPRYLCRNMKHCMCCLRKKKDKDSNETLFTQETKNMNDATNANKCCSLLTCCMNKTSHIPLEELGPQSQSQPQPQPQPEAQS